MARRQYVQGIFSPLHPEKYIGGHRPRFLSSYELKFMRFADNNPNVLKWGSENVVIPYLSPLDGRIHRYMVDNFLLLKTKEGQTIKYLVEIKPAKQTVAPKTKNRKNKRSLLYEQVMYAQNTAKWAAAKQWCIKNGCKFLILTEEHLRIKTTK